MQVSVSMLSFHGSVKAVDNKCRLLLLIFKMISSSSSMYCTFITVLLRPGSHIPPSYLHHCQLHLTVLGNQFQWVPGASVMDCQHTLIGAIGKSNCHNFKPFHLFIQIKSSYWKGSQTFLLSSLILGEVCSDLFVSLLSASNINPQCISDCLLNSFLLITLWSLHS